MCCLVFRFWWAKIRGLTHIGDYEELEKFSRQKRSPIGYEVSYTGSNMLLDLFLGPSKWSIFQFEAQNSHHKCTALAFLYYMAWKLYLVYLIYVAICRSLYAAWKLQRSIKIHSQSSFGEQVSTLHGC